MAKYSFEPPTEEELKDFESKYSFEPPTEEELKSLGLATSTEEPGLLESAGETAYDVGRGALSGLTFGGLEELIAGGKALFDDKDFTEAYRKYLEQEEAKSKESKERSPYASFAGELAGSVAPALLTGGATMAASGGRAAALGGKALLPSVLKGAGVGLATGAATGAVQGALTSEEGRLIGASEEEKQKLLEDIKGGAELGGALGGVLGAGAPIAGKTLSKAKEAVEYVGERSELVQKLKHLQAIQRGEKLSDASKKWLNPFETMDRDIIENDVTKQISNLTKKLVGKSTEGEALSFREALNKEIEDVLDYASRQKFDLVTKYAKDGSVMVDSKLTKLIKNISETNPRLATELNETLFTIKGSGRKFNPRQGYELRTSLKDQLNKNINEPIVDDIKKLVDHIDDKIENVYINKKTGIGQELLDANLPGSYKKALATYNKGLEAGVEPIIRKGIDPALGGKFIGSSKAPGIDLFKALESTIENAHLPGQQGVIARRTLLSEEGGLIGMLKNIEEAAKTDPEMAAAWSRVSKRMGYDSLDNFSKELTSKIQDLSKTSSVMQGIGGIKQTGSSAIEVPTSITQLLIDKPVLTAQGAIGKYVPKATEAFKTSPLGKVIIPPAKFASTVYAMPEEALRGVAKRLIEYPGFEKYGANLVSALDANDSVKKNAILFSLMQQPKFRGLLGGGAGE